MEKIILSINITSWYQQAKRYIQYYGLKNWGSTLALAWQHVEGLPAGLKNGTNILLAESFEIFTSNGIKPSDNLQFAIVSEYKTSKAKYVITCEILATSCQEIVGICQLKILTDVSWNAVLGAD